MNSILAYDLGTGGVKASLFDENLHSMAEVVIEYPTYYSQQVYHEQEPADWWKAVIEATSLLLQKQPDSTIQAIAFSGTSLGVVAVDKDGNLTSNRTPIWSDARASAQTERFFKSIPYETWYYETGCGFPAPLYSLFKIMWYQECAPEIYDRTSCFMGIKDYINFLLTGKMAIDVSSAAGSGVYSLTGKRYLPDYIEAAGLREELFAPVFASDEVIGTLTKQAAEALGLPSGIPVVCGGVDNACMTLGAGCIHAGDAYASLGSSAWVTAATKEPILDFEKMTYVWPHCVPGLYIPSAGVFSSGSSLRWVRNTFFGESLSYKEFDKLAEKAPVGAHGLLFCPAMAGGASTDVSTHLQGSFSCMNLGHTREDIARATLEGISYHLKMAHDFMAERTPLSDSLTVVGGGAKSPFWCQIYADILNCRVVASDVSQNAASLGAAALAMNGIGLMKGYEAVPQRHENIRYFEPVDSHCAYYRKTDPLMDLLFRQQGELGCAMHELVQGSVSTT